MTVNVLYIHHKLHRGLQTWLPWTLTSSNHLHSHFIDTIILIVLICFISNSVSLCTLQSIQLVVSDIYQACLLLLTWLLDFFLVFSLFSTTILLSLIGSCLLSNSLVLVLSLLFAWHLLDCSLSLISLSAPIFLNCCQIFGIFLILWQFVINNLHLNSTSKCLLPWEEQPFNTV